MQLTTPRLVLIPLADEHFEIVYNIFTDEHVRYYLLDNDKLTKEQVEDFLSTSKSILQTRGLVSGF